MPFAFLLISYKINKGQAKKEGLRRGGVFDGTERKREREERVTQSNQTLNLPKYNGGWRSF